MHRWVIVLLAAAPLFLLGCPSAVECQTDADCGGDLSCRTGACVQLCNSNADCPDEQLCDLGYCQAESNVVGDGDGDTVGDGDGDGDIFGDGDGDGDGDIVGDGDGDGDVVGDGDGDGDAIDAGIPDAGPGPDSGSGDGDGDGDIFGDGDGDGDLAGDGDGDGADAGPADAGLAEPDAGSVPDGGVAVDAGPADAGLAEPDAGSAPDAGVDAGVDPPVDAGVPPPDAGPPPVDAGVEPDPCDVSDPFGADVDGDCFPDLVVGAPGQAFAAGTAPNGTPPGSVLYYAGADAQTLTTNSSGNISRVNNQTQQPIFGRFGASVSLTSSYDASVNRRWFAVGEPDNEGGTSAFLIRNVTFDPFSIDTRTLSANPPAPGFGEAIATVDEEGWGSHFAFGAGGATLEGAPAGSGAVVFVDAGFVALAQIPLANWAPTAVVLTPPELGATVDGTGFGGDVTSIGDQDGDGVRDFLIAAPDFTVDGADVAAVVVSGTTGYAVISLIEGDPAIPALGTRVHDIGDVDGDGVGDFALGAPDEGSGVLVAYLSEQGARVDLTAPGLSELAAFGAAVTTVGDVDGDDLPDLLVGAPRQTVGNGNPAGCDDFAPAGYNGNCTGTVYLLVGGALDVAGQTGAGSVNALPCLDAPATSSRLGTSLRALGVRGTSTRIAVGAPGVLTAAGSVHIYDLGPGGSCPASPRASLSRGTTGDLFGEALGR